MSEKRSRESVIGQENRLLLCLGGMTGSPVAPNAVSCVVLFHRNLDKIGEENVAVPLSW